MCTEVIIGINRFKLRVLNRNVSAMSVTNVEMDEVRTTSHKERVNTELLCMDESISLLSADSVPAIVITASQIHQSIPIFWVFYSSFQTGVICQSHKATGLCWVSQSGKSWGRGAGLSCKMAGGVEVCGA